jgi:carbonic anhydrase
VLVERTLDANTVVSRLHHEPDMLEIVWLHDPESRVEERQPRTAFEARARLEAGSAAFASLAEGGGRHVVSLPPDALGLPSSPGSPVAHEPFAAVLGCSDARVPAELVFGQAANDLFVVRVAGNVAGTECLGSLDYAVTHLPSLKLLAVVGHTGCGAVTAAVEAFLAPETYFEIANNPDLRSIVDAIMAAVAISASALVDVHGPRATTRSGYRGALIETAVVVNAALTASLIRSEAGIVRDDALGVAFGVYDLVRRSVGVPTERGWRGGLVDPPTSAAALGEIARKTGTAVGLHGESGD